MKIKVLLFNVYVSASQRAVEFSCLYYVDFLYDFVQNHQQQHYVYLINLLCDEKKVLAFNVYVKASKGAVEYSCCYEEAYGAVR